MKQVVISTPYITLGQLLKWTGVIDTGGQAKHYLAEHVVLVNETREDRRGKKLKAGDIITLEDGTRFEIVAK